MMKDKSIVVRVTDEFHTVWEYASVDEDEVITIVSDWIRSRHETPIYDISICMNPE